MSFADAWGPPNLSDGVSGRQNRGQIEDSRRGQVEFGSGRILSNIRVVFNDYQISIPHTPSPKGRARAILFSTQYSPRTNWAHLLFVPFPWVNSSISTKLSCGATSPIQSAARFYFPPMMVY